MVGVLLDTHAWAWTITNDPRLSAGARSAIGGAEAVHVSPISFFEIGQKVRLGRRPEMAAEADRLEDLLRAQGGVPAPLTPAIVSSAARLERERRDPFDRIIPIAAAVCGPDLVTRDPAFADGPSGPLGVRCVW